MKYVLSAMYFYNMIKQRPDLYDTSGRRKPYSSSIPATPIIPREGIKTDNGWVFSTGRERAGIAPRIVREEPIQLPNGVSNRS